MSKISNKKIKGSTPARALPEDLATLFAGVEPTRAVDIEALTRAAAELDTDPDFVADYTKGLVVEDILRALESSGLTKNALAEKMGTSRQYLSKILNEDRRVNFTVETLAQLAAALKLQLCVRLLPADERVQIFRSARLTTHVNPIGEFPEQQDFNQPEEEDFIPNNLISFKTPHERPSLSA